IAGVVLILASGVIWRQRDRLRARALPAGSSKRRSSVLLGASITAVELPTAFPYFAAIAAIVGSGLGTARQIVLLVVFNACFVLPLVTILGTLTLAGSHAERILTAGRNWLQAHWPALLAGVALLAGLFVTLLGVTGLTGRGHGHLGRVARRIHRLLHLHP
ncbi:MAG: GAP family protein, partial [Solirubrobacterales bacterium]|nr:GAP family protein [Solirubrobacterales bacterium]